jgi:hypothetical protein
MVNKYTLKIPQKLVDVFQSYLDKHPELGYTFVSEFIRDVVREQAKELLEDLKGNKEKEEKIKISEGEYTREELKKLLK